MRNPIPCLPLAAAIVLAGTSSLSFGDGFSGPDTVPTSTVAALTELADGALVKLEGQIVSARGDDHYDFRDATGSTVIEIDEDLWRGVDATPETRVRLWIEIDDDFGEAIELEAERLEIIE